MPTLHRRSRMSSQTMTPSGNRVLTGGAELSYVTQTSNRHNEPAYKVSFQIINEVAIDELYEDFEVYSNVCVREGTGGIIYQSKKAVIEVDHDTSVVEYYIVASDIDEYMSDLARFLHHLHYYIVETNRVEIVDGSHIPPDRRHIPTTRLGGAHGHYGESEGRRGDSLVN